MQYYVGVDIGGTNVRTVIANEEKLLIKIQSNTVKEGPLESVFIQVRNLILRGLKELNISRDQIAGIGTSSAGPFVAGVSLATPNICADERNDWTVIPYLTEMQKYFGPDKKYDMANDCVAAVKAESLFGAGKGLKNVIYITISTGVGSGIIANGHLLQGKGKNAGHLGHTIVQKDGYQCSCGQKGCIETIISGIHIPRRAREAGLKVSNAKEVFDLFRSGDPIAQQIIKETAEYIGILFINAINMMDTEMLIVGGSVFLNNYDVLMPLIEKFMTENSMVVLSEGVQIVRPKLGQYVGDLAGLSLVIPDSWIKLWQETEPWKKKIDIELTLSTEESMNFEP